ncbi:MAG: DUF3365 domain-containing protein [Flavobacteriales bacterium]|jgi:uncharacterized Zn finger protein (UPF0148 family)|nr:DUF3365 domain-containing protein [Flavobacteriales bacterium]
MKSLFYTSFFLLSIGLISCGGGQKNTKPLSPEQKLAEGEKLLKMKCNTCHIPTASKNGSIAPPMAYIKDVYKQKYPQEANFIQALSSFAKKPKAENSLMPEMVKKYNLMPPLGFSKKELEQIAFYIYRENLPKPKWYQGLSSMGKKDKNPHADMISKGMKIVRTTKGQLGKNLMGQINKNGTLAALDFCHLNAKSITDSMQLELNAQIKRVSDKPRNKNQRANSLEQDYINFFKDKIKQGETLEPQITITDAKKTLYAPITTNKMCLQCHGTPDTQIKKETLLALNKKYPLDEAVGYGVNELRGIWVVEFDIDK